MEKLVLNQIITQFIFFLSERWRNSISRITVADRASFIIPVTMNPMSQYLKFVLIVGHKVLNSYIRNKKDSFFENFFK